MNWKTYLCRMYVRKKKNRSGTVSVVIVSKQSGAYREIRTIGVSSEDLEISSLVEEGNQWIRRQNALPDLFANNAREKDEREGIEYFFNHIEKILLNGSRLILNRVYGLIGFDRINDTILKDLVVARICHPSSKAATVDYLKNFFDEDIHLDKIYRYLDVLQSRHQSIVHQISVEHTRRLLGGSIGLVFYDVTTLYFETDYGDDLRKPGFSKDGKHALPQVVLGLLVSDGGYPLAYSIYEGNKYEGHTMLPVVEAFVKKFDLKDLIIVADSGLMNRDNIKLLEEGNYRYILGARIKNESAEVKQWIFSLEKKDGCFYELGKIPKCRLIVGYSEKRAKKDAYNRGKGVKRLEKEYETGSVTKEKINKRGYNKFLEISDDVTVRINYEKVQEEEHWDGWKGYLSNTDLPAESIYAQYRSLWQVERAFRVTKGTLELRPMFHFTKERIQAHVCICFVAYKVSKELERILKNAQINISVNKVLDIAGTITTIKVWLPETRQTISRTMLLTDRHKSISCLFDEEFWKNKRLRSE